MLIFNIILRHFTGRDWAWVLHTELVSWHALEQLDNDINPGPRMRPGACLEDGYFIPGYYFGRSGRVRDSYVVTFSMTSVSCVLGTAFAFAHCPTLIPTWLEYIAGAPLPGEPSTNYNLSSN